MATITIQKGDTLGALAARYGTTVQALAAANGIKDPNKIQAGASLNLPGQQMPSQNVQPASSFNLNNLGSLAPKGPVVSGGFGGTAQASKSFTPPAAPPTQVAPVQPSQSPYLTAVNSPQPQGFVQQPDQPGSLAGSMSVNAGHSDERDSGYAGTGVTGKPIASTVSSQKTGNNISNTFGTAPQTSTQTSLNAGGQQQLGASQFANVIDSMRSKLAYNNDLIKARQLLVTQLYDHPLTEAEIAQLPPNFQDIARGGDNRQVEMRIRLLNDEIQGRTNTMDQSINYLTTAYKDDLTRAEREKEMAMGNIMDFVGAYGDQAGEAIKAMYGEDYLKQLESYGINVGGFGGMPKTLDQLQEERLANPGSVDGTRTYVDSAGDIIEIGSKQLSATQANLLSEGNQLSFVLDPLYNILESKKGLFGPVTGKLGQLNPYNTAAQTIDDDLRRAAQTIGKYMEGGVLRKEDEEKYRKMLPQLTDTPDVAKNKLEGVTELLKRKQLEYIDSYARAGYDVSKFISSDSGGGGDDADFWSSFKPEGSGSKTLGSLSAPYESNGKPGTVSTGKGDPGGVSYGTYQLTTNNVKGFVQQSKYANSFKGLTPGTSAFSNQWKAIAAKDPNGFEQEQQKYIEKTHYQPQAQKLSSAGVNVNNLSPVLKDVIFSTSVQHGPATNIVLNSIKKVGPNASEEALIKEIYKQRWAGGANFANSSQEMRNGVYNRFFGPNGEMNKALAMVNNNLA